MPYKYAKRRCNFFFFFFLGGGGWVHFYFILGVCILIWKRFYEKNIPLVLVDSISYPSRVRGVIVN